MKIKGSFMDVTDEHVYEVIISNSDEHGTESYTVEDGTGATEGAKAGATEGAKAEAAEGAKAGATEGAKAGATEGAKAGATEGTKAEATEGAKAGAKAEAAGHVWWDEKPVTIESKWKGLESVIIETKATVNLVTDAVLTGLFSSDATDTAVRVTCDGVALFDGYVEPRAYTQAFDDETNGIALNCIDGLTAMQYKRFRNVTTSGEYMAAMKKAGMESMTAVLTECIRSGCGNVAIWYDGSKAAAAGDGLLLDDLMVNVSLYLGSSYDNVKTCYEVVEDLLRYLGLHVMETQGGVYIFSRESLGKKIAWTAVSAPSNGAAPNGMETETAVSAPSNGAAPNGTETEAAVSAPSNGAAPNGTETETAVSSPSNGAAPNGTETEAGGSWQWTGGELSADHLGGADGSVDIGEVFNQVTLTVSPKTSETVVRSPLDSTGTVPATGGKVIYMTQYSADGDGIRAARAFWSLIKDHEDINNYSDKKVWKDFMVKPMRNIYWTIGNGTGPESTATDWGITAGEKKTGPYALTDRLRGELGALLIGTGEVDHKPGTGDTSKQASVSMTSQLVVSVNGNGSDTDPHPTDDEIKARMPVASYRSGDATAVYSPTDGGIHNYLVFSGTLLLQPLMPTPFTVEKVRRYASGDDFYKKFAGDNGLPSMLTAGSLTGTSPSKTADKRYLAFEWWNNGQSAGTRKGWIPNTGDGKELGCQVCV